jgi:hypothetical protein
MQFKMLVASVLVLFATSTVVQAEGVSKEFKFKKGLSSGTVEGCVVGADEDEYLLEAKQGQTLTVSIKSEEDNAVFTLYYHTDNDWNMVQGAGGDEGVKQWKGRLPGDTDKTTHYKIEVGKERGNACYTLKVAIK